MLIQGRIVFLRIAIVDGSFLIELGKHIAAFLIKDPCIGIEVCRIVRILLYPLRFRSFCLGQIAILSRKELGIVVRHYIVLVIVFQCLIVALIYLFHIAKQMVGIADIAPER